MKLDIKATPQVALAFLRDYVERRLHTVVERFGLDLSRIAVDIGDANGPRGGVDKYCRITARIVRIGDVFTEAADARLQVAVDQAVDRIENVISRAVVRTRAHNGESPRNVPAEPAGQS